MRQKTSLLVSAMVLAMCLISNGGIAGTTDETFRTEALLSGVQESPTNGLPTFTWPSIWGWNLVNLAMGRPEADTSNTNQVLVMTFPCDLSSAQLSVYDKSTEHIVAVIADSTGPGALESMQRFIVKSHTTNAMARFVAQFLVNPVGTSTNGLNSGFLTITGRVHLNPTNGCPEAVKVALDPDSMDTFFNDKAVLGERNSDKLVDRAGLAHMIGVLDVISAGSTNTILIPNGLLDIRTGRTVLP